MSDMSPSDAEGSNTLGSGKNPAPGLAGTEGLFEALVEGSPDAIIGADADGVIRFANQRTVDYFGYPRERLIGMPVDDLLPERLRSGHAHHRASYTAAPSSRPMGTRSILLGRRRNGSEFPIAVSLNQAKLGGELIVIAVVRDVTERKQADAEEQRAREYRLLRQQALEINDVVVQGLTTAIYALDADDLAEARASMHATIASARQLMSDLIGDRDETGGFRPGDLLRGRPAVVTPTRGRDTEMTNGNASGARVVIADDTPDIRFLLRKALSSEFQVVGEAEDGKAAIQIAKDLQPDAILVDLAMPMMDGLEAIPLIRAATPRTKIVVLSGYGRDQMGDEALAAGAHAYLEKGRPLEMILETLREVCGQVGDTDLSD